MSQQGGRAGRLVRAEAGGDRVEERALAVVEVALGGGAVGGAERDVPVVVGAPLVAQQGERGVGLDEALVLGDGGGEPVLDAVLQPQQATERVVVALGGVVLVERVRP